MLIVVASLTQYIRLGARRHMSARFCSEIIQQSSLRAPCGKKNSGTPRHERRRRPSPAARPGTGRSGLAARPPLRATDTRQARRAAPDREARHAAHLGRSSRASAEAVRLLLEGGASVGAADGDAASALFLACERGHLECVRLFLEANAAVGQAQAERRHAAAHCKPGG